jgi:hypothetical protein
LEQTLFLTGIAGNGLGSAWSQTSAVSIIGKSLVAMTGLQMLIFSGKALMQICTCNSCFLGVSNAGTGNRLCEADAAAFGESLTALVGLHTLNLSGTDPCISIPAVHVSDLHNSQSYVRTLWHCCVPLACGIDCIARSRSVKYCSLHFVSSS